MKPMQISVDRRRSLFHTWAGAMGVRATVCCWILGLGVALSVPSGAQDLPFTHFTTDSQRLPLPSSSVQRLHQDSLGFVWLAFFSEGLGRYDGHSLELYGHSDGLPDTTVRELIEDSEGYFWVGTDNGLAVSAEPLGRSGPRNRVRFLHTIGDRPLPGARMHANALAPDPVRGGLWVGTARGLLHLRLRTVGDGLGLLETRWPLGDDDGVSAVRVRSDGSVWIAGNAGGLWIVDPPGSGDLGLGTAPRALPDASTPPSRITVLYESADGTLWAGTFAGGLWRLAEGQGETLEPLHSPLAERIRSLVVDSHGDLWASSLGAGLLRVEFDGDPGNKAQETTTLFDRRHGLPSDTLWSLIVDHENTLWIGHNGGVSRLRPNYRAFSQWTGQASGDRRALLPEPTVFAVVPPAPGLGDPWLWVGTGGGVGVITPDGRADTLTLDDGLLSASVYSLARDPEGRLWISTAAGLNVLSFDATPPEPLTMSIESPVELHGRTATLSSYGLGILYTIRPMPNPEGAPGPGILCLSGHHGLACYDPPRWIVFGPESGLPASGTTAVDYDDHGHAWVGTKDSGVWRSRLPFSTESFAGWLDESQAAVRSGLAARTVTVPAFDKVWSKAHGAPTDGIRNLVAAHGKIWVGTSMGLAALAVEGPSEKTLASQGARTELMVDRTHGLGGDHVQGIAVHPATGHLWVTQNRGLAELVPTDGQVLRTVTKADGLVDNENWQPDGLKIDGRGAVYFGTPKGLSVYRPDLDVATAVRPRPVMRRVHLEQDPRGRNALEVEYAALSYVQESRMRFKHRLVGYQDAWSEPTPETRLRYTNLPAFLVSQTYVLELVASADGNTWSEPLALEVRIRPPWWLSLWAVLGVLLVLGLGLLRQRSNA